MTARKIVTIIAIVYFVMLYVLLGLGPELPVPGNYLVR
jgi:hypothetical protein